MLGGPAREKELHRATRFDSYDTYLECTIVTTGTGIFVLVRKNW